MRRIFVPAAVVLLAVAGAANAHPKLVGANPAPNATVAKPARVELRFSEKLMPAFSKADLAMVGANGRTPVKLASVAAVASDGRTLVLTPKGPLRPGRYNVAWVVVSSDTHRITGTHAFAVK